MSTHCQTCSKKEKINQHRLDSSMLDIIYESCDLITSLSLPRKYTTTHNDSPLFFSPVLVINIMSVSFLPMKSNKTKPKSSVNGSNLKVNTKYISKLLSATLKCLLLSLKLEIKSSVLKWALFLKALHSLKPLS